MRAHSIVVGLLALLSGACSDPTSSPSKPSGEPPKFGEPTLIKIEASGARYEMAIALSGATIDRLVEPLSSSMAKSVSACPDVGKTLARNEIASVRFRVKGGAVDRADDTVGSSDACLANELVRAGVDTKESFEAWAQLRKPPGEP